jgi:hypothetical protein
VKFLSTRRELAKLLGVKPATVTMLVRSGTPRAIRLLVLRAEA